VHADEATNTVTIKATVMGYRDHQREVGDLLLACADESYQRDGDVED
jgi:hypothetical protein